MNTITGVRVTKSAMMPRTDNKTMVTTFSLSMPRINKTLVSLLTPKSHWLTSNPLTQKFMNVIYFLKILL
ncbi:hypothetical protein Hanom_Chr04g00339471 [Helianthus anomalus]